jgi:hypothetical protein
MPSRGSQDPHWQRWIPKPVILAEMTGAPASKDVEFSVPVPDSRLRVKVTLLFRKINTAVGSPNAALWLYEAEQEDAGYSGEEIPCTDLVGTSSAPLVIPEDSGLLGFSQEFITAADYINGRLTVTATSPSVNGYWILQTRYQPQNTPFSEYEWRLVIAQCAPSGSKVIL